MKKSLLIILLLSITTAYTQPHLEPNQIAKARCLVRISKAIGGIIGGLVVGAIPVVPVGVGVTECVGRRGFESYNNELQRSDRNIGEKFVTGLVGGPLVLMGAGMCGGLASIGSAIAGASIGAPLGVLIGKKIGLYQLSKKYHISAAELEKMIASYVPPRLEDFQRLPLPKN